MSHIVQKVLAKFPNLGPRDFALRDDQGVISIMVWNVDKLGPQPTIAEIEAWQPPAERRKINKDTVEQRMSEAGTLGAAMQLLFDDPDKWRRWNARSFPWVYADDPDTIALIRFVGSDPDKILAPE